LPAPEGPTNAVTVPGSSTIDAVEHGDVGSARVGEADTPELDPAIHSIGPNAALAHNRRVAVDQLEDPLRRAAGAHEVRPQVGQRAQGKGDDHGVDGELGELADTHPADHDLTAAEPKHGAHGAVPDHHHSTNETRHDQDPAARHPVGVPDRI